MKLFDPFLNVSLNLAKNRHFTVSDARAVVTLDNYVRYGIESCVTELQKFALDTHKTSQFLNELQKYKLIWGVSMLSYGVPARPPRSTIVADLCTRLHLPDAVHPILRNYITSREDLDLRGLKARIYQHSLPELACLEGRVSR